MALEGLDSINAALRARGVALKLVEQAGRLYARGTVSKADGTRAQQRVPLLLPAAPPSLLEAELRVLALAREIQTKGCLPEPLPWAAAPVVVTPAAPAALTCAGAIAQLERQFWQGRVRSSAAERTWSRIQDELKRLPAHATLSLELLIATIEARTAPGSRSRLEACKTYARLLKAVGLEGADQLSRLRGTYTPQPRELPDDEQLLEFLLAIRPLKWGWATCAAATFGVRPAEVPSLVIHDDGTGSCLSLKIKGRKPVLRTCFALPRAWIEELRLLEIEIPGGARWTEPDEYDSGRAKRWVESWRHGLRAADARAALQQLPSLKTYDLRHAWAVRSIRTGLPMTLCAKAMGHSVQVHEAQYHRWLSADALRSALAALAT